jgi:hypothetical protein
VFTSHFIRAALLLFAAALLSLFTIRQFETRWQILIFWGIVAGRGGPGCLNRLAVWISGSPLVDHAAARSGWPKYIWSGVLAPRAECGRTLL